MCLLGGKNLILKYYDGANDYSDHCPAGSRHPFLERYPETFLPLHLSSHMWTRQIIINEQVDLPHRCNYFLLYCHFP